MTTQPVVHTGPAEEHASADELGNRWFTGVILLIVADASFVVALSFAFLYLRVLNTEGAFHPAKSATASLWWSWIITACMVGSYAAYRSGLAQTTPVDRSRFVSRGTVGVALLALALVLNIVQMATFPFSVNDNAYSSAVFVIAAGNVFHLLLTLFVGVGAVNRVRNGLVDGAQPWSLRVIGIWWLWVCVAAAIGALTITVANGTVGK